MKLTKQKIIESLIGINLLSFGIAIILRLNVGMDPFDSFSYLIGNIFKIDQFGNAILITHLMFFIILYILIPKTKEQIIDSLISIGAIFIITRFINIYELLINFEVNQIAYKIMLFIPGFLITNLGLYYIAMLDFIIPPYDKLVVLLAHKFNLKIGTMRLICDSLIFVTIVIAFLLNRQLVTISFGTIIFALGTGPNIRIYEKLFERRTDENILQ